MAYFVSILNILCILSQVAFCYYLLTISFFENFGNPKGNDSQDVRDKVKENVKIICNEMNLITTNICGSIIVIMTMKEIYQKAQLVCLDSISMQFKILVYIQISVATLSCFVANLHIVYQN